MTTRSSETGSATLRASLDSMLDGFASFRTIRDNGAIVDFEWTYANASAIAAYPFGPDVVGKSMLTLRPSLKANGLFDRFVTVVETGEPIDLIRHEYVEGDEQRAVEMRVWRDDDGFSMTWRDVTDRERALAALASSEQRFRVSVDHLSEALLIFRAERHDGVIVDFVCTYANAAAAQNARTPIDEMVGSRMLTVFPSHRANGMFANYIRVAETGERFTDTFWYEGMIGNDAAPARQAFEVQASKLDDGIVIVARDITEQTHHQAELARQRAELETAYRDALAENERAHAEAERQRHELESRLQQSQRLEGIGQLAGGIAHDFNNLLAAILNYSSFIKEDLEAIVAADGERWQSTLDDIKQVTRATERAAQLTRQLLAFARREIARPEAVNLNVVIADMLPLLSRTIREDIKLVTVLEPELWPVVADPAQLEQVLLNVVLNARDAMPDGGTITITTSNTHLSLIDSHTDATPAVSLTIRDSGTGMPPDVVSRAFEPFFTTKEVGVGTGLGLAMTYGIITEAGGTVRIESELDVGTAIIATFPAAIEEEVNGSAAEKPQLPTGQGETILLVEDDEALREVTSRILTRRGYTVVAAHDGEAAIEIANSFGGRIDVLLTDVVMPTMNGREVADVVTETRPECRVVYMSGYARPALAVKGTLEAGINLLPKPFTERQLLAELSCVLHPDRAAAAKRRVDLIT